MPNRLQHICYAIAFCFLVSSCQSDQETPAPQSPLPEQAPAQAQVQTKQPQKVSIQGNIKEEKPTSALQPPAREQAPAPVQIDKPQKAPVQDNIKEETPASPPAVNLDLSKELLEKIDADSQQELTLKLQRKMEIETAEQRKVKISGRVLIDENEKDLTRKIDGGEVKISVPFN
ncbi:MAG: hypothetical protein J7K90_04235 [Desulfuromusa sp.]|nr:hypothetical protein [Desulfuromusa sp.]